MAKNNEPAVEGEEKKGGKKKLIIIIVAVLVLIIGGGGAAYYFFLMPKDDEKPKVEQTVEPPLEATVINLDSMTINLANRSGFLKLAVSVRFNPNVEYGTFTTAVISDEIIKLYSRLTLDELSDPAYKELAKNRLRDYLNEKFGQDDKGKDAVLEVYYTEFVTQGN